MTRNTALTLGPWLLLLAGCGGAADPDDAVQVSREEVIQTLQAWRDRLEPLVPAEARRLLAERALALPRDAAQGVEPIAVTVRGAAPEPTVFAVEARRRDWAYAAEAAGHSLIGAIGKGEDGRLDLALFFYLEAALLHPEEAEHLANVAFHLNARGEHRDARRLLLHARLLAPESASVASNLAFASHRLGEHEAAIGHGLDAVALRPEPRYLERLRGYFLAGGYQAEADALAATESQLPTLPSFDLPPPLSTAGEGMRARIAELSAEMNRRAQEIADRYQASLDAALASTASQLGAILAQHFGDCPLQVALEGGDEVGYRQCMQCYLPGEQKTAALARAFVTSAFPVVSSLEREWWALLRDLTARARAELREASLPATERRTLEREVHHALFLEQVARITRPRQAVKQTLAELERLHAEAQNAGCGKLPGGELKQVEEPSLSCQFMPFMCRPWSLYFGVGSFGWNPDGTMQLSLGAGAALKLEYNLETDHAGIGFGLGHNLGPLNAELSLMFTSKDGVTLSAEAKLTTPYGVLPGADGPKLWTSKLAVYENHP